MTKKRALVAIPVAVLVGLVALALVLGSRSASVDSLQEPGTASSDAGAVGEPARDAVGGKVSSARQAVSVDPLSRAIISTGQITLHPSSMSKARSEVLRLVASWNGTVADEQSTSDRHGRMTDTTMTLRVPSASFSDAMTALAGLGRVEQMSRKSEDVTTQVIDNDARIRAAERTIRQIENLLSRARQMGDIIAIESDLARRQADLDSLRSQQAWLEDQTSLSTINLYLSRPGSTAPRGHEARGFLAGLAGGWNALGAATVLLLTVLGALLPFAVLVGLLGVPLWLVVRRRWARLSAGRAPARSA